MRRDAEKVRTRSPPPPSRVVKRDRESAILRHFLRSAWPDHHSHDLLPSFTSDDSPGESFAAYELLPRTCNHDFVTIRSENFHQLCGP